MVLSPSALDTVNTAFPCLSSNEGGRVVLENRLGPKWLPDAAVALTRTVSPSRRAPMSSMRRRTVAVPCRPFDAVVWPDSSLPFEVTLTQSASPTWVISYVAAADADGANASRSPAASTPAIRRVMRLSMSHRLPGRFYRRRRRLADRIGMRARRQAPPRIVVRFRLVNVPPVSGIAVCVVSAHCAYRVVGLLMAIMSPGL